MANVLFNHFTKEASIISRFAKLLTAKPYRSPRFPKNSARPVSPKDMPAPDLELRSFVHDGVDMSPAAQKTMHAIQDTNPHGMPSHLTVRTGANGERVLGLSDEEIARRGDAFWKAMQQRILSGRN